MVNTTLFSTAFAAFGAAAFLAAQGFFAVTVFVAGLLLIFMSLTFPVPTGSRQAPT